MQNSNEVQALRHPDNVGTFPEMSPQQAAGMLNRWISQSTEKPFIWSFIDKPADGQVYLLFLPSNGRGFPTDGIQYLQREMRTNLAVNAQIEMEVIEDRFGFTPGTGESMAGRVRRRYRFCRGVPDMQQRMCLLYYTRGQVTQVPPQAFSIPPRGPLGPINQPAVFVMGPKAGQRVPMGMQPGMPNAMGSGMGMADGMGGGIPNGMGSGMASGMPNGMGGMGIGMGGMSDQAAVLARQRSNYEALDAQNRLRGSMPGGGGMHPGAPRMGGGGMPGGMMGGISGGMQPGPGGPGGLSGAVPSGMLTPAQAQAHAQAQTQAAQRRQMGDGSAGGATAPRDIEAVAGGLSGLVPLDELDVMEDEEISTRTLAGVRYRRNHEWMNDVFMYAAFGDRIMPPPPKPLKEIFDKDELESKLAALQAEVTALQAKRIGKADDSDESDQADLSMTSAGPIELPA